MKLVPYRGLPTGCFAPLLIIIGAAWFIGSIVLIVHSFLTIGAAYWWAGAAMAPVVAAIGFLLVWGGIRLFKRVYWGKRE